MKALVEVAHGGELQMRWPFVSRRRYEDALLDADRKNIQLDRAARTYLAERDNLRLQIASCKKPEEKAE